MLRSIDSRMSASDKKNIVVCHKLFFFFAHEIQGFITGCKEEPWIIE